MVGVNLTCKSIRSAALLGHVLPAALPRSAAAQAAGARPYPDPGAEIGKVLHPPTIQVTLGQFEVEFGCFLAMEYNREFSPEICCVTCRQHAAHLHDLALAILACDREREDEAIRDIVGAI